MIGRELKTGVDVKYFNSKVTVDKELFSGERYVYRVQYDDNYYILKGYQILLEHLKPGDEDSRQRFIKVLSAIAEAYQEYFFSRIACVFSQHFSKPLEIDQYVELTPDKNSLSYLYIEILFEYGGEPLNTFNNIGFDSVYNLMRQSTSALTLLHNTGLMHLDIKPINMAYNKDTNLLKMMDVGTSFGYGTHSIIYKPTEDFKSNVREFTKEFAPPEILRNRNPHRMSVSKLLMGNADAYCWAMCFYAMLLGKSVAALIHEANFYKLTTPETYSKFMSATRLALENIPIKELKEKKKKEFIIKLICEGLNLKPEDRPTICEIQRRMKEFERKESIQLSYYKMEKDYEGKMMRMLMINSDKDYEDYNERVNVKEEIYGIPEGSQDYTLSNFKQRQNVAELYTIPEISADKYMAPDMKKESDEAISIEEQYEMPEFGTDRVKQSLHESPYSIPEYNREISDMKYDVPEDHEPLPSASQRQVDEFIREEDNYASYTRGPIKKEVLDLEKEADKYLYKNIDMGNMKADYNRDYIEDQEKCKNLTKEEKYDIIKDFKFNMTDINEAAYSNFNSNIEKFNASEFPKEKYEVPEYSRSMDRFTIQGIRNEQEGCNIPEFTKDKNMDSIHNSNEENSNYEIPEIGRAKELYSTQDKEMSNLMDKEAEAFNFNDPKDSLPNEVQENVEVDNKKNEHINKKEEEYYHPWASKEKALYMISSDIMSKEEHGNFNMIKDEPPLSSTMDELSNMKKEANLKSKIKEVTEDDKDFMDTNKDENIDINESKAKDKPENIPLNKIGDSNSIFNFEHLLKDDIISSVITNPAPELSEVAKKPLGNVNRDETPESILNIPVDLSPQNTPSDDVIDRGYNQPTERSQFAKRNLYEGFTQSSDAKEKAPPLSDNKTPEGELNTQAKNESNLKKAINESLTPVLPKAAQQPHSLIEGNKSEEKSESLRKKPESISNSVLHSIESSQGNPQSSKEDKKVVIKSKVCEDCMKSLKPKGLLVCGHSVCEDCLTQFAANYLANNLPYKHCGFCSTCKRAERLSKCKS